MDNDGKIKPTLTIRQIPFNTESFVNTRTDIPATAFRTLPAWKVTDEIINNYSVGKSESLRINFVRITAVPEAQKGEVVAAGRAAVGPASDIVDIERNGLRGYVTSINSVLNPGPALESTRKWTAVVTDRSMGSHLKYSGTMGLAGVQEPVPVGDNLLYGDLLFHIEQVEHSLTVDGNTGLKSFSTTLAISNGVPATGPVLPGVVNRGTNTGALPAPDVSKVGMIPTRVTAQSANLPNNISTNAKKDDT
jgi:hypothetical protein